MSQKTSINLEDAETLSDSLKEESSVNEPVNLNQKACNSWKKLTNKQDLKEDNQSKQKFDHKLNKKLNEKYSKKFVKEKQSSNTIRLFGSKKMISSEFDEEENESKSNNYQKASSSVLKSSLNSNSLTNSSATNSFETSSSSKNSSFSKSSSILKSIFTSSSLTSLTSSLRSSNSTPALIDKSLINCNKSLINQSLSMATVTSAATLLPNYFNLSKMEDTNDSLNKRMSKSMTNSMTSRISNKMKFNSSKKDKNKNKKKIDLSDVCFKVRSTSISGLDLEQGLNEMCLEKLSFQRAYQENFKQFTAENSLDSEQINLSAKNSQEFASTNVNKLSKSRLKQSVSLDHELLKGNSKCNSSIEHTNDLNDFKMCNWSQVQKNLLIEGELSKNSLATSELGGKNKTIELIRKDLEKSEHVNDEVLNREDALNIEDALSIEDALNIEDALSKNELTKESSQVLNEVRNKELNKSLNAELTKDELTEEQIKEPNKCKISSEKQQTKVFNDENVQSGYCDEQTLATHCKTSKEKKLDERQLSEEKSNPANIINKSADHLSCNSIEECNSVLKNKRINADKIKSELNLKATSAATLNNLKIEKNLSLDISTNCCDLKNKSKSANDLDDSLDVTKFDLKRSTTNLINSITLNIYKNKKINREVSKKKSISANQLNASINCELVKSVTNDKNDNLDKSLDNKLAYKNSKKSNQELNEQKQTDQEKQVNQEANQQVNQQKQSDQQSTSKLHNQKTSTLSRLQFPVRLKRFAKGFNNSKSRIRESLCSQSKNCIEQLLLHEQCKTSNRSIASFKYEQFKMKFRRSDHSDQEYNLTKTLKSVDYKDLTLMQILALKPIRSKLKSSIVENKLERSVDKLQTDKSRNCAGQTSQQNKKIGSHKSKSSSNKMVLPELQTSPICAENASSNFDTAIYNKNTDLFTSKFMTDSFNCENIQKNEQDVLKSVQKFNQIDQYEKYKQYQQDQPNQFEPNNQCSNHQCDSQKCECDLINKKVTLNSSSNQWIQLAGHEQSFYSSNKPGIILKKNEQNESVAYKKLSETNDQIVEFLPKFYSTIKTDDGQFIELQDLLTLFDNPCCMMDIKMGCRTFLENDVSNVRARPDLYEKLIQIDSNAATQDEHKMKAITKLRYMTFRENLSSSSTLGFRIEGFRCKCNGMIKDFKYLRKEDDVKKVLKIFLPLNKDLRIQLLKRLKLLKSRFKDSDFFRNHEVVGSSLLIIYDDHKIGVWMIDFAKTVKLPTGIKINHETNWNLGNHEDGYLTGLNNLISIIKEIV